MNWFGFLQLEEQLVPALPPKSLVVMDNASYHSVIKDGTKAPTSATRKGVWFYFVFNMITKVSPLFWGYDFKSFYY
jgi:hypothetical protein